MEKVEVNWRMNGAALLLNAIASMPEDEYGNCSHEPRLVVTRDKLEFSMLRNVDGKTEFACLLAGGCSKEKAQRVLELAAQHCLHPADEKMWIGEEEAE